MKTTLNNTRFEAKVSPQIGDTGIKDVLVIQCGPAKGHFAVQDGGNVIPFNPNNPAHSTLEKLPIWIDQQTLEQIIESGNAQPEVQAKMKHGDIDDTIGGNSKFRIDEQRDPVRSRLVVFV